MKLYNKKGLLLGLFWFLVGISGLILELVKPGNNMAVHIRDIVLFSLLLLFSIRQIVRAFSKTATREDMVEERDERNRLIDMKTKGLAFRLTEGISYVLGLLFLVSGALAKDDAIVALGLGSILTVTIAMFAEVGAWFHYEKKL